MSTSKPNEPVSQPSLPLPWMRARSSPALLLQGPSHPWIANKQGVKTKPGNSLIAASGTLADTANIVK